MSREAIQAQITELRWLLRNVSGLPEAFRMRVQTMHDTLCWAIDSSDQSDCGRVYAEIMQGNFDRILESNQDARAQIKTLNEQRQKAHLN